MKNRVRLIILLLWSVFHCAVIASDAQSSEVGEVEAGRALEEANADYRSVIEGKGPVFAKPDLKRPLPADGGTTFYIAPHYTLTVKKSLVRIGNTDGYLYGPIIKFDKSVVGAKLVEITCIKFYSKDQISALLQ